MIRPMDATTSRDKSALTRRRLLDAAEALVADEGYSAPSHRSIARRAGVHVALVNYHYGSKEMLLEAVVARRADQLIAAWKRALADAMAGGDAPSTEEVLRAYWAPFGTPSALEDGEWKNYLCTVAWLSQAEEGDAWWSHQFGGIERIFRDALSRALPGVAPDAIERGFRYARELLDDVLLRRCNKASGRCNAPPGLRENDVDGLIAFLAAGLDALPLADLPATTISRNHVSAVSGD
jgi:AcrR family transcriptional regulator